MNHPKVTTIAEAFRLAAKIANDAKLEKPVISKLWANEAQYEPLEAAAYTPTQEELLGR